MYYFLGYYFKSEKYNNYLLVCSIIISLMISILWNCDILTITFNMKIKSLFYNPIIQVVFPISITIVFLKFFSFIPNHNIIKRALSYIGESSIVIMYLHIPIFNTLIKYFNFGYILQILISILICIFLFYLFNKNKKIKKLFIG